MHNYVLEATVAANWHKTCQGFVQANTNLVHYFHGLRVMLFHFTIQFHYLGHIALLGRRISQVGLVLLWREDDASLQDDRAVIPLGHCTTTGCEQGHRQICAGSEPQVCWQHLEAVRL